MKAFKGGDEWEEVYFQKDILVTKTAIVICDVRDKHWAQALARGWTSLRLSNAGMKVIMKNTVNHVYKLLRLKADDPEGYERQIACGERCALSWDDPE